MKIANLTYRPIRLLATVFMATVFIPAVAQDVHFSQFTQTPLLINPAKTGVYYGTERIILNHKNQWAGIGNYQTTSASFDLPLFKGGRRMNQGYLGAGIYFYSDRAGDSRYGTTQISLSVSGILNLNDYNKISVGIQGGGAQRTASMDNLQWGNQYSGTQYDPTIPHQEFNSLTSFASADFATGVQYEYQNTEETFSDEDMVQFSVGIAAYHVNKPRFQFFTESHEQVFRRWVGHFSGRFDIPGSYISFVPSAAYFRQGPNQEVNVGTLFRYQLKTGTKVTGIYSEMALSLGAHYRLKDAVIPQLLIEFGDFGLGVSYDFNTSSLSQVTNYMGGYEITLYYANMHGALFKR